MQNIVCTVDEILSQQKKNQNRTHYIQNPDNWEIPIFQLFAICYHSIFFVKDHFSKMSFLLRLDYNDGMYVSSISLFFMFPTFEWMNLGTRHTDMDRRIRTQLKICFYYKIHNFYPTITKLSYNKVLMGTLLCESVVMIG